MTPELIARYQSGGDIYDELRFQYGQAAADAIAAAAATGDEHAINSAISAAKFGGAKDTSTLDAFGNLLTDPLAVPLEGVNNQIGKAVGNVFKNGWVLLVVVVLGVAAFLYLGGGKLFRKANA